MRERVIASWASAAALIALPAAYALVLHFGLSGRVFRLYLPTEVFEWAFVGLVGALVGAEVPRQLRPNVYAPHRLAFGVSVGAGMGLLAALVFAFAWPSYGFSFGGWLGGAELALSVGAVAGSLLAYKPAASAASRTLPVAKRVALGCVLLFALGPQLRAFPAHGTLAQRNAWARAHVREYPRLVRLVKTLPVVTRDLARVVQVAPTGGDKHSFAREMNGDDLSFTLEVVGAKGTRTLHADCTIEGDRVLDWRSGTWHFGGKETRVERVPGCNRKVGASNYMLDARSYGLGCPARSSQRMKAAS